MSDRYADSPSRQVDPAQMRAILRNATARRPKRRHPAELTSDRLAEHLEQWPDTADGALRDEISHVRHWLESIADGTVGEQEDDQ
jgi:hypothetical protein